MEKITSVFSMMIGSPLALAQRAGHFTAGHLALVGASAGIIVVLGGGALLYACRGSRPSSSGRS